MHTCGIYGFYNWLFAMLFYDFVIKNLANWFHKIFVQRYKVVVYPKTIQHWRRI